jgi:hypothetical protein
MLLLQWAVVLSIAASTCLSSLPSFFLDGSAVTCKTLMDIRRAKAGTLGPLLENVMEYYEEYGYLTYNLVKDIYEPSCLTGSHESHIFARVQCLTVEDLPAFCWCADQSTGEPQQNTSGILLAKQMQENECEAPKSCEYNKKEMAHGAQVTESCFTCVCYDGIITCNASFCNSPINMTSLELYNLRINLLKEMYVDYASPTPIDNYDLEQIPGGFAYQQSKETVPWKFNQLDKYNYHTHISYKNLRLYRKDLFKFTDSFALLNCFPDVVDLNKDYEISREEWTKFFTIGDDDEKYLSVINSLIMTCVAGSGSGFGK